MSCLHDSTLAGMGGKHALLHVITPALPLLHQVPGCPIPLCSAVLHLHASHLQLILACCLELHDLCCMLLAHL